MIQEPCPPLSLASIAAPPFQASNDKRIDFARTLGRLKQELPMSVCVTKALVILTAIGASMTVTPSDILAADSARGAQAARQCHACHSLDPGRHLTGPSLANIWGSKAGEVQGFGRYSDALRTSDVVWDQDTLDAWLRSPAELIPGNTMVFPGISDAAIRLDLVAYLRAVSEGRITPPIRKLPNLKEASPDARVRSVRFCGDAYRVTTADGTTHTLWEFNLRFKTDGSVDGPKKGEPVLVGSGMRGDRASLVFADAEEISSYIRFECA